jgi:hypothetical protein
MTFERRLNSDVLARLKFAGIQPSGIPIYDPVTMSDVAKSINQFLAQDEEASKLVIERRQIKVISGLPERLMASGRFDFKDVGSYKVNISLDKGLSVRKDVSVQPLSEKLMPVRAENDASSKPSPQRLKDFR